MGKRKKLPGFHRTHYDGHVLEIFHRLFNSNVLFEGQWRPQIRRSVACLHKIVSAVISSLRQKWMDISEFFDMMVDGQLQSAGMILHLMGLLSFFL